MGAEQSSARDQTGAQGGVGEAVKTCYYELLGVDRQASDDEIKKAYRRKALELHPDRNYGNVESATRQFADVQSAYEVLSDPQERSWYDSHRDAILRNDGPLEDRFEHNVRLTSTGDIISLISKFTKNVPFTDASEGFYGGLRSIFSTLAREEDAACDWEGLEAVQYPDFGCVEDSYEDVVKPFYAVWTGFGTKKTFSWMDFYRYSEAPDRRIRRLMEKENKRLREEGIREFNDAVRSLVAFVRKRDPRYVPNSQSEADRQKLLREATAAQAARSRAQNQAKFSGHLIPEWMKTQEAEEETPSSGSELWEEEHYECVLCRKTFKSERQYDTHEKSKKHVKAVQQLKRQMQRENGLLNLETDALDRSQATPQSGSEGSVSIPMRSRSSHQLEAASCGHLFDSDTQSPSPSLPNAGQPGDKPSGLSKDPGENTTTEAAPEETSTSEDELYDEYASREEVEDRFLSLAVTVEPLLNGNNLIEADNADHVVITPKAISAASNEDGESQQKLGKAKAKRAKKAARQEAAVQGDPTFQCVTCDQLFCSKTKLFSHIKELNHARPIPKAGKGVKGKKRSE